MQYSQQHAVLQWFHLSEASFMLVGPQPLYQWMIAPNSEKKDSQRDAGINKIKAVLQVILEPQLTYMLIDVVCDGVRSIDNPVGCSWQLAKHGCHC